MLARLPLARSRPWIGYGVAVLLTLVAWEARYAIGDGLPPGFPYLTFFPAVILTAFFFGLGPGVLASILSGLAAWYFFIPPFGSFALDFSSAIALAFYVFIVAVDISLVHWMQQANASLIVERRRSLDLAENRELLFKELQHRVGNNLQMVAALIALHKRRLTDEDARLALNEASRRIGIVGRIQRKLYQPRGEQLGLAAYIDEVCRDVIEAGGCERIDYRFSATVDALLPPDKAIPTALVVAESFSNAVEHAYGVDGRGVVEVSIEPSPKGVAIILADNGVGLPEGFDLQSADSLGLRIARTLARSIGGTFSLQRRPAGPGTVARLDIDVARP